MDTDRLKIFIEKARKRHGDKYDYSKVEYKDSVTKVKIICPIHGEFEQAPAAHVRGNECPLCANRNRGRLSRRSLEEFISKAREVHGDKYDYSKVEYVNANTKVKIICPIHGEFEMRPMSHLLGQGCPRCHGMYLTQEDIIKRFREVHGDKYDYSKVVFKKVHEKVKIICPIHGEFEMTPSKHYHRGDGCPKCGKVSMAEKLKVGKDDFIKRAREIHGDKYDYSQLVLTKMCNKVKIVCPIHGEFWQIAYDHLNGHSCPHCGVTISKAEDEIYEFICTLIGKENVIRSERSLLNGMEIDIYLPSLNIGIEYNGLRWHSSAFKEASYHLNKLRLANSKGISLIQVFEDEWNFKKDIVKSKLKRLLKADTMLPKVMARKCVVNEISKKEAKIFIEKNHIQGYKGCSIAIGCFYGEQLVGVMTFEKSGDAWVLNRFATDISMLCQGVGGKLFSYFVKTYDPLLVKSFADLRWTINIYDNLYIRIGFILDGFVRPQYRYIKASKPMQRIHKFNFRKKVLAERYGVDVSKSEDAITKELGYDKVFDCGLARYVWKK